MDDREGWLTRTFVELSDTLVDEFDLVEFLQVLVERCVTFVDAADAGLVLADASGTLRVMVSSSERMHVIELFEIQNEDGPCFECCRTGKQVLNASIATAGERWPQFAPRAAEAGYRTAHALPMRLRADVIGAINLFHADDRTIPSKDVAVAQALGDIATIAILQDRSLRRATALADELQEALRTRVVIEQAKGVLAERLQLDMEPSFEMMRSYARRTNRRLGEIAEDVVRGRLQANELERERPGRDARGPRRPSNGGG